MIDSPVPKSPILDMGGAIERSEIYPTAQKSLIFVVGGAMTIEAGKWRGLRGKLLVPGPRERFATRSFTDC